MVQVSNEDRHRFGVIGPIGPRAVGVGAGLVRASIALTAADGEESASLGARLRAWSNAITNGIAVLDRSEFEKPSELVGSRGPAVTTRERPPPRSHCRRR